MTVRLLLEGMMPHRALNRLRREGICLKNVQKRKKNQIVFTLDEKDTEKVFAIYPNVCYNSDRYTPYTVRIMPDFGLKKRLRNLGKRLGLFVGGVIFLLATVLSDSLVLRIEIVGETVHGEAISQILCKNGVEKYKAYPSENADLITSEILRLDGVGFCALRKVGSTLLIEVRNAPFSSDENEEK